MKKKVIPTTMARNVHVFSHIKKRGGEIYIQILNGPKRRRLVIEGKLGAGCRLCSMTLGEVPILPTNAVAVLKAAVQEDQNLIQDLLENERRDIDTPYPATYKYVTVDGVCIRFREDATHGKVLRAIEKIKSLI